MSETKEIKESKETKEPEKKPSWIKMKPADLKKLVEDLAKQGKSPAQIGLILRDKHGIPKVKLLGKKITQILEESEIKYPTEKQRVDTKITKIKSHIDNHKHDYTAKRALTKKLWDSYHLKQAE
jgi:small subunit ribosomal protein S15